MRLRNLIIGSAVALLTALWSAPVAFAAEESGERATTSTETPSPDSQSTDESTSSEPSSSSAPSSSSTPSSSTPSSTSTRPRPDCDGPIQLRVRGCDDKGDRCDSRDFRSDDVRDLRRGDSRDDRCRENRHRHHHDGRDDDDDGRDDDDDGRDDDDDGKSDDEDQDDDNDGTKDSDDSSNFPVGAPETGGGPVSTNVGALFTLGLTGMTGSGTAATRRRANRTEQAGQAPAGG